jgi:cysteine desulfurase
VSRHYLDHASTSPLRPEAFAAMVEVLRDGAADPGRMYAEALEARHRIEVARKQVADLVGARPREVVFTSGATEAITAAAHGACERGGDHVVCPLVEHSAVLEQSRRGDATWVGVDDTGRVDVDELVGAIRPSTSLVHLQWVNHETGTVQPVAEVAAACRERGVLLHVDAAQAVGHVPVDFGALGCDLLSLSGHKFGAPHGTGALLVRLGLRLQPLLLGGAQERARRAGQENIAALVGLGAAAEAVHAGLDGETTRERELVERAWRGLAGMEGVRRFGPEPSAEANAPHLLCVGIDGVEPQAVVLGLDRAGLAVHSGSACAAETIEPSPVLAAMGVDADRSLRISVGWGTTADDVDALLAAVPPIVAELRALAGPGRT